MSYNILSTHRFEKELKRLLKKFPSLKSEMSELLTEISANPKKGTLIGNSCFKIRLAIASKGKGKRGGTRIITHVYIFTKTVYLLTIFDKSDKADLKPNELKEILESLDLK